MLFGEIEGIGVNVKLSIIVPIYNAGKYLDECISSIVSEMNDEMELLLINDGSRDDSLNICKKYESKNVKIFDNQNHGVSYTRNFGINKAKGEYLSFVDADDFLYPNWGALAKEVFDGQDDYDIIYFTTLEGKVNKKEIIDSIIGLPNCSMKNMAAVWSKLYRKTFIINNNISFDERIINGEDELFNLKAIFATDNYICKNSSIYYYRDNRLSATKKFSNQFISSNDLFLSNLAVILSNAEVISKQQADEYIDFCLLNSLLILIFRISALKNRKEQKEKLDLMEREDYRFFLERYIENPKFGKRLNKTARLLKKRKYNSVLFNIKLRTAVKKIIGKIKAND